jgi:hypothetical protein
MTTALSSNRAPRGRRRFVQESSMPHSRPAPPRPDLVRRPTGPFGWLDARLLTERWLDRLGADGTAVLVLLALAADGHGSSFYGRSRMALALGLSREGVDRALTRLLELGLVAHRPWRADSADGVWQLLPLAPRAAEEKRGGDPVSIASVLARFGLTK